MLLFSIFYMVVIERYGMNCWNPCLNSGNCAYCGSIGACCRLHGVFDRMSPECSFGTNGCFGYHCCVESALPHTLALNNIGREALPSPPQSPPHSPPRPPRSPPMYGCFYSIHDLYDIDANGNITAGDCIVNYIMCGNDTILHTCIQLIANSYLAVYYQLAPLPPPLHPPQPPLSPPPPSFPPVSDQYMRIFENDSYITCLSDANSFHSNITQNSTYHTLQTCINNCNNIGTMSNSNVDVEWMLQSTMNFVFLDYELTHVSFKPSVFLNGTSLMPVCNCYSYHYNEICPNQTSGRQVLTYQKIMLPPSLPALPLSPPG